MKINVVCTENNPTGLQDGFLAGTASRVVLCDTSLTVSPASMAIELMLSTKEAAKFKVGYAYIISID